MPTLPLDPARTSPEAQALEAELRQRVVGQDRAIRRLGRVYQVYLAGLAAPGRPLANLLFLGPRGSGKTRLVEAVAEALFNNANAVLKIDCAEFQHNQEIAKLIGSPPEYLAPPRDPTVDHTGDAGGALRGAAEVVAGALR